jgi:hypothetical protein
LIRIAEVRGQIVEVRVYFCNLTSHL